MRRALLLIPWFAAVLLPVQAGDLVGVHQREQLEQQRVCAGCDLRGLDLSGLHLIGADLRGADLRGASLRGSNLEGADLTGSDLIIGGGD